jgi:sugar lactone lactonase YvrE
MIGVAVKIACMTEVNRLHPHRAILGEGPIWRGLEPALYWIDLRQPAIHRYDPVNGALEQVQARLGERIGAWSSPRTTGWRRRPVRSASARPGARQAAVSRPSGCRAARQLFQRREVRPEWPAVVGEPIPMMNNPSAGCSSTGPRAER